jgi:hypothetical protein
MYIHTGWNAVLLNHISHLLPGVGGLKNPHYGPNVSHFISWVYICRFKLAEIHNKYKKPQGLWFSIHGDYLKKNPTF